MNINKLIIDFNKSEPRRNSAISLQLLPLPACLIDPLNNRIIIANDGFNKLTGSHQPKSAATDYFIGRVAELSTFTQAILTLGGAQTNDLKISIAGQEQIDCLIFGSRIDLNPTLGCLFVFLSGQEIRKTESIRNANDSIRSGLLEWKRLEALYHQAESLNELILNSAGDGIFGIDKAGNTTFMNPAASKTLGWNETDLFGQNMHRLIHHHHPDGTFYAPENCPIYQTLTLGKRVIIDNEVFWKKSGESVPVEYIATPISSNNEIEGAVIIFRDISERIESKKSLEQALRKVDELKQRLEQENAYLRDEVRTAWNHSIIIGQSAPTKKVLEQIQIVGPTNANVLITGESGTGKELVAQAIHDSSDRKDGPLIKVNCAAIPKDLFESEFFGHVKGAFSGATANRTGRFELANGGTLFLDEVGELPIDLQGKLLRAIQEQKYERVGEGITRNTDVRIIAATNRNLRTEASAGRFREDLYFRLDVFPIHCHPLRERLEDIPLLANHFIQLACARFNLPTPSLSDEAVRQLQHYDWPGNARELQNVIERGVILAAGSALFFDLPSNNSGANTQHEQPRTVGVLSTVNTIADIQRLEEELVIATLETCEGRISGPFGAAKKLGINSQTLYSRLRKYKQG